jgi:hypothetical protein
MNDIDVPINNSPAFRDAAEVAAVAREQAEIQARIISAKKFPRNELDAWTKIKKAMLRPVFAERSFWSFPRGGKKTEGPSVHLAREAARCWGNIASGFRVISIDEEYVHLRAFATDLENNTTKEFDEKFKKLVYRKSSGWVTPDERDLRELTNKHGAIIERNAILQIIPRDVIDDAVVTAKITLSQLAAGELKANKQDIIKKLVSAFSDFGITASMLEEYLGHELSMINETELTELRGIGSSLRDGNSKPSDYFKKKSNLNEEN